MESHILLLRPDRAGDAIKSLPAIRAYRREFPELKFSVLTSDHNASIFAHEPNIHVYSLPRDWRKLREDSWLSHMGLSSLFPAFQKIINLLADPSPESLQLLSRIPAKEKYSAHPPQKQGLQLDPNISWVDFPKNSPAGRDETSNAAWLLSQALWRDLSDKIEGEDRAPVLCEADQLEASEKMGRKTGEWIGFCPFANLHKRTPPLARWKRFFETVSQETRAERLFLFGTPADYPALMELRSVAERRDRIELCFPSSFRTLGAYLLRLDRVVAIDSGPLHLARALGIPTLGFLSGGDAERWFPAKSDKDVIIPRGWLSRHPGPVQMLRAFRKWGSSAG